MMKYVVLSSLILVPCSALAGKTVVGLDADVVINLSEDVSTDDENTEATAAPVPKPGAAMTLRAGYQLSFVIVDVALEAGIRSLQLNERQPLIVVYGTRVTVGKLIKPGFYAHGLYDLEGNKGWEAGLTGDFTAIPVVNIGLQAGYSELNDRTALNAGIHGTVQF